MVGGVKQNNLIDHYGYGIPHKHMEKLVNKYRGAVVIGADTDACVLSTMFNLWDNNIKPTLLTDYCISSGGQEYHECALKLMMRQFGPRCVIDGIKSYKDFI